MFSRSAAGWEIRCPAVPAVMLGVTARRFNGKTSRPASPGAVGPWATRPPLARVPWEPVTQPGAAGRYPAPCTLTCWTRAELPRPRRSPVGRGGREFSSGPSDPAARQGSSLVGRGWPRNGFSHHHLSACGEAESEEAAESKTGWSELPPDRCWSTIGC